jgi:hypothetical protein
VNFELASPHAKAAGSTPSVCPYYIWGGVRSRQGPAGQNSLVASNVTRRLPIRGTGLDREQTGKNVSPTSKDTGRERQVVINQEGRAGGERERLEGNHGRFRGAGCLPDS